MSGEELLKSNQDKVITREEALKIIVDGVRPHYREDDEYGVIGALAIYVNLLKADILKSKETELLIEFIKQFPVSVIYRLHEDLVPLEDS